MCGCGFSFWHRRQAGIDELQAWSKAAGIRLGIATEKSLEGIRISSSAIRALLAEKDLKKSEHLLGRKFSLEGKVVQGAGRGRTLGVHTANLHLQHRHLPLSGVFLVEVLGLEKRYFGVANLGVRPTVDGVHPSCEVHLFNFSGDIYRRRLTIVVLEYLRPEQKFESLAALSETNLFRYRKSSGEGFEL